MSGALAKLQALRLELKAAFVERDEVIDGALAGLLAGEHVLLLGPVGTAKSMLAGAICGRIDGAAFFSWLLTKFSTPEEIFGPVSLKGLEQDAFRRLTADKLPEAHIAFLDEIFKSNSAILNSLLAILNERIFHNGATPEAVPLLTLFAASNELPEEGELMALYDRFLLRFQLGYIAEDSGFLRLLTLDEPAPGTSLTLDELRHLQKQTREVAISRAILGDVVALRSALQAEEIDASDRRYRKALDVLRAYALLDGRDQVKGRDLRHLVNVLWNEPEEASTIEQLIRQTAERFDQAAQDLIAKAEQQKQYAARYWPNDEQRLAASVESLAKLRGLLKRADELLSLCEGRDDDVPAQLADVRDEIAGIVDVVLHGVGHRPQ